MIKNAPPSGGNIMKSDRKDQPAEEGSSTSPPMGNEPEMKGIPKGADTMKSNYAATKGQTAH